MAATLLMQVSDIELAEAVGADDGGLWLTAADLEEATGWVLKPEGLCREDACVPLPPDGSWQDDEGRVDVVAFMERMGRPVVSDPAHGLWAIGETAQAGGPGEDGGEEGDAVRAPDFTLPDIDGTPRSLSELRGRKVLLLSWGSYCGCSFDLPAWQAVYEDLHDDGLEIMAVAFDTAGTQAVQDRIRPADLDAQPDVIRRLRGWSEAQWARRATPSFPCVIDEEHRVAAMYGMTNVPMCVWIDEEGRIVRPSEPAGVSDHFRSMDPESFEIPDTDADRLEANRRLYLEALQDWVRRGAESEFALAPDEVRRRMRRPSEDEVRAALHARIAHRLYRGGDPDDARRHLDRAVELCPDAWTYRRQAMVLDPDTVGDLNVSPGYWAAMDALGRDEFYPPVDLPGFKDGADYQRGAAG
ncbi:redoxin domain-containing protein [Baekduia soli]|uniref:Redoxin domain-containing protein n=1 Tax=Baekduia soli TaxID=496014 RepID=A0A5B8U718_9ACTN|nr:redoxin domain-containing protein [Baekduia soli]QEC48715.1 redoxin domain-containing protein [Baekduia soli]